MIAFVVTALPRRSTRLFLACAFAAATFAAPVALAAKAPPVESEPACNWSRLINGEWVCTGRFKLARGEGDPNRIGYCGTVFKAGTVIVTALELSIASPQEKASPFYLTGLYLDREKPEVTVIGGTFRNDKEHPEDVFCNFKARLRIK